MTVQQCYNDFLKQLFTVYEEREATNITEWVFENVTGCKRHERNINRDKELSAEHGFQLKKYLQELLQHKPVQYVLHEAWFYKMKFYVNENVLIPRPETEELVSWMMDDFKNSTHELAVNTFKILDVGTGSGCIPISIKKELPLLLVDAIDASKKALDVAIKNADNLNTDINFLQIDFLNESLWNELEMYDVIVSNPPYIPEIERQNLQKNVIDFEPAMALFVSNNNPFIFYEMIAKFATTHLKDAGKIFVEIHEDFSKEVCDVFSKYNFETEIKEDIYGKKRMIKARKLL